MDYAAISPEIFGNLYKSYEDLGSSPLNQELRILIELRISQINNCRYCCKFHSGEAEKSNISKAKLEALPIYFESELFSEKEKAALKWSEIVTTLNEAQAEAKQQLKSYFSEREIVDITACASIMNALNRVAIHLKEF